MAKGPRRRGKQNVLLVPGLRPIEEIDTVADVITEQSRILDHFASDKNGVYWFTSFYRTVTQGVWEEVNERGAEPGAAAEATVRGRDFLSRLDVHFYKYYLEALTTRPAPPAWQPLLSRRDDASIHPMLFGMSGVVAHITCDLPQAIVDTLRERAAAAPPVADGFPVSGSVEHAAFTEINDILYRVCRDCLTSDFASGAPGLLHLFFPHALDHVADGFIKTSRAEAWDSAEQFWNGTIESLALEHQSHYISELIFTSCRIPASIGVRMVVEAMTGAMVSTARAMLRRLPGPLTDAGRSIPIPRAGKPRR